jgi:hypothetical protein
MIPAHQQKINPPSFVPVPKTGLQEGPAGENQQQAASRKNKTKENAFCFYASVLAGVFLSIFTGTSSRSHALLLKQ